jgi:hypothetical protein
MDFGNSIKLKKLGFGRRNYLSYKFTLGPMAHATLMYKINGDNMEHNTIKT